MVHHHSNPSPLTDMSQLFFLVWLRKNLFNSWINTILSILLGTLLFNSLLKFGHWAGNFAKWEVIPQNLPLYFVGRFPRRILAFVAFPIPLDGNDGSYLGCLDSSIQGLFV